MNQEYYDRVSELIGEVAKTLGSSVETSGEEKDGYLFCRTELAAGEGTIRPGQELAFINALQYIVNRSLNTSPTDDLPRVVLDINGQREKRELKLAEVSARLVQEVKDSGEDRMLEPLDPRERRVVHMSVAAEPDVGTRSVGDEFLKNIIIFKKDEHAEPADGPVSDPS
jgi:spoIIIJ-associated protein